MYLSEITQVLPMYLGSQVVMDLDSEQYLTPVNRVGSEYYHIIDGKY